MKKTLLLLMTLMLVLGTVFSPAALAEAKFEEPLTISWVGLNTFVEGSDIQKLLEERFNVKFENMPVNSYEIEAYNAWIGAGNSADYMQLGQGSSWSVDFFHTCVDQGLVRSFPVEWLYEYMPTWMSIVENAGIYTRDEIIEQISVDGAVYGVPVFLAAIPYTDVVRQDWLDKLNLSMPTNLQEYEDMLRAFTFGDPDGNGIDDTYGYNASYWAMYNYVFSEFGVQPKSYYLMEDGSVQHTGTMESYKEALKLLQRWYRDGLIDPEIYPEDRDKVREKWYQGKQGTMTEHSLNQADGYLNRRVQERNPDARFSILPSWNGHGYMDFTHPLGSQFSFMFGADCSDEKVIRIMQMKETMVTDKDLWTYISYGQEGVDWHYDENGALVQDHTGTDISVSGCGDWYLSAGVTNEQYCCYLNSEQLEVLTYAGTLKPVWKSYNFAAPQNDALDLYGTDVKTIVEEYLAKALTDKIDIDATWDAYVQSLKDAGIDKICDEFAAKLAK